MELEGQVDKFIDIIEAAAIYFMKKIDTSIPQVKEQLQ